MAAEAKATNNETAAAVAAAAVKAVKAVTGGRCTNINNNKGGKKGGEKGVGWR